MQMPDALSRTKEPYRNCSPCRWSPLPCWKSSAVLLVILHGTKKNALPTDYVAVSKVTGYNAQEYPYGHDNHYGCYSSHEAAVSLSPTLLILNSRQLRLCSSSMHDAHDAALSTAAVKKSALPFPAICFFQNERAYWLLLSCRVRLHACQQHHHQNA